MMKALKLELEKSMKSKSGCSRDLRRIFSSRGALDEEDASVRGS